MPCGDSSTFPTEAVAKIGQAFVNKQFSMSLVPVIGDLACFVAGKIGGGDAPIPFPKPTFGAGVDHPDEAEVERLGHMMVAAADAHRNAETGPETGLKAAPNVAAMPWLRILSIAFTIVQGLLLSRQPAPVNPAGD